MDEAWKQVVGHPRYDVSNMGRVRTSGGVFLKQATRFGYKRTNLRLPSGKVKTYSTHLLVMSAFIGPCPPGKEAHHINHDPADNRLWNLAYITHSENVQIAYDSGNKVAHPKHGESHPMAKVTDRDVKKMRSMVGKCTQRSMANHYGISPSSVCNIIKRKAWKHL